MQWFYRLIACVLVTKRFSPAKIESKQPTTKWLLKKNCDVSVKENSVIVDVVVIRTDRILIEIFRLFIFLLVFLENLSQKQTNDNNNAMRRKRAHILFLFKDNRIVFMLLLLFLYEKVERNSSV